MRGLVPRIHVLLAFDCASKTWMAGISQGRGHDGGVCECARAYFFSDVFGLLRGSSAGLR